MRLQQTFIEFLSKPVFNSESGQSNVIKSAPFKLALLFSVLLMIVSMFAIAVVYFQSYSNNELLARNRVTSEVSLLSSATDEYLLKYLPSDMAVAKLPLALPKGIKSDWTKKPGIVSSQVIKRLDLSLHVAHQRSWVALIPNSQGYWAVFLPIKPMNIVPLVEVLFYSFVAIILIMCVYGALINGRSIARIEKIDETANSILRGDMDKRIAQSSYKNDEYSNLIGTFNDMLDRMQQLMRDLRQVNQNIAHDLKTPLNRLRSRLELSLMQDKKAVDYPEVVADSIEDIDTLLATFNALLLMGNLDAKVTKYPLKQLVLKDLLLNIGDLYNAIAEDKQHLLQVVIDEELKVLAHEQLLSQCISNLLDNAIKYTPDNGKITFSLRRKSEFAVISIADNGPGIPDTEKDKIFEPFSRLDISRHLPGNGLGMSLVRSIIKVHHGRIELLDNEPGLIVNVYLRISS